MYIATLMHSLSYHHLAQCPSSACSLYILNHMLHNEHVSVYNFVEHGLTYNYITYKLLIIIISFNYG